MKTSLKGHSLPENADDARHLALTDQQVFGRCVNCNLRLCAPNAAFTRAGWLETQISSTCEPCFDALFYESDDDNG